MLRRRKGQSTLEYALLISVAVAALVAINIYMKKGVTGKLKESTDQIGRQFDPTSFSTAWKAESQGQTITTEERDSATGSTTTTIGANAETITKSEYESFGTAPQQRYSQ